MSVRALFSRSLDARRTFVADVAARAPGAVIHIHPANLPSADIGGVYRTTYEAINKTDVWLRLNAMAGDTTTIVLECPARYPKITSPKFQYLQRLTFRCGPTYLADIVPMTQAMEYVYTTCSYLGRGILGYPHYYAWRENYQEMVDGKVLSAHDPAVIAAKLAPLARIDYPVFTPGERERRDFTVTEDERAEYAAKKAALFADGLSPTKIVTALADTDHAQPSRTAAVLDVLDAHRDARVYVYCNLGTYATRLGRAIKKAGFTNATATSYAKGRETDAEVLVYAEPPIVKSYLLLDAEARSEPARSIHLVGEHRVGHYLQSKLDTEIGDIDGLTRALSERQEDLLADRRTDGRAPTDRPRV